MMSRPLLSCILVATVPLLIGSSAAPPCPECRIEATHVANVGDTTGGVGFIGQLSDLFVTDSGDIVISDLSDEALKLYSSSGEFLREIGRSGGGPGEFVIPTRILPISDSAFEVFDPMQGRRHVYSHEPSFLSVEPFGTAPTYHQIRVGSHYVTPRRIHDPDAAGLPLHVYDETGVRIRSFGADPPIRDVTNRALMLRVLTPSSDSTFWAGNLLRYRLEHWTLGGDLLAEFEREPSWFPPQADVGKGPPPHPSLIAISWDQNAEIIWTATIVPREDWADVEAERSSENLQRGLNMIPVERLFETIVEAVSPRTGAVLARARLDFNVVGFTRGEYVFASDLTPSGDPVVRVWKLKLHR